MITTNRLSKKSNLGIPVILLFALLAFSSCSKQLTHFTQKMNNDFGWTESDVQKVQFYLSNDIVLRRAIGASDSRITNGQIKLVDGREVEEVIFRKGTPGVVVFSPKADRLAVSFEHTDDKYLIFGPNPNASGRYTLLGKEWNKKIGKVTYNGMEFTTSTQSSYASLLVDLKRARNVQYNSTTVGGRKI